MIFAFGFIASTRLTNNCPSSQLEASLAEQYNCSPVLPYIPCKWPLALDLLIRQYRILSGKHTFEELTPYFDIAPTCCIHFFSVTGYFTTDPENIESILSTNFKDYVLGSRRLATFPLLGEGIFSQDGAPWKHSRELIRRQFVRVQKQTPQALTVHVEELVGDIQKTAIDGVVDLRPLMFEYTLDTTTMLLFGEPHSNMDEEKRNAVRDDFDAASFAVGIRVRLADGAFLYNPPRFQKACKAVREWATFFAAKAIQYKDDYGEVAAADKYAFIIDLWREMQDVDLVRDQLLHILVAGRDSTASLLSWTLYVFPVEAENINVNVNITNTMYSFHLVRNPDVMERLKTEISTVPTHEPITRDQIQKLSFLRCCLNESKFASTLFYPQTVTVLISFSSTTLPNFANEYPVCQRDHCLTSRWWTGRPFSCVVAQGNRHRFLNLSSPPP